MDQELRDQLQDTMDRIESHLGNVDSYRVDAQDEVRSAEDAANNAASYVDDCWRTLNKLEAEHDAAQEQLDRLRALIKELEQDGKGTLGTDIAKWAPAVNQERKQGLQAPQIAEKLKISEFLVNTILSQQNAA